jgi:hypothetical protein
MKTFIQTLLIATVILIQTSIVNGQYTYQTAKRIQGIDPGTTTIVNTDSNAIPQSGIGLGCATITSQPVWMLLGFCSSGTFPLQIDVSQYNYSLYDSASVVMYGPFSDTLNLASKLINANIDTCQTDYFVHNGSSTVFSIYPFNYSRGDIYLILILSTTNVRKVQFTPSTAPSLFERDTLFCPLCNARLSELYQPVCTVTFDSISQKNKIIWPKDIFTPAQDYVVFRKNITGTLDTLGFQSISQLSEYIDSTSSPLAKSYEYKLGIRDSCGQFVSKNNNFGAYNLPFITMHLIAYPTGNNSSGLIWNKGSFNGPFYIYRTDPSGVTTLIDSVGLMTDPQTYTDINAPAGMCSYQIGVNINPPCVASVLPNTYTTVKSNPGYVTVTGINELADLSKALSVEPNPFNQYTKIDLKHFNKQNLKVVLRNLTGQTVAQYDNVKTNELIIERNNLSQGLYFLEVTGDGLYARKKLVVE